MCEDLWKIISVEIKPASDAEKQLSPAKKQLTDEEKQSSDEEKQLTDRKSQSKIEVLLLKSKRLI